MQRHELLQNFEFCGISELHIHPLSNACKLIISNNPPHEIIKEFCDNGYKTIWFDIFMSHVRGEELNVVDLCVITSGFTKIEQLSVIISKEYVSITDDDVIKSCCTDDEYDDFYKWYGEEKNRMRY